MSVPPADRNSEASDGAPTIPRRNGWVYGILVGVVLTLVALPPVRFTLLAQLQFALAERSLPFLHALSVRPTEREIAMLDRVASSQPDDYLVQVGRATVMATQGGLQTKPHAGARADGDNTLYRLGEVVQRFADAPGAYAHLSRYMMNDRIRLERLDALPASATPSTEATHRNRKPDLTRDHHNPAGTIDNSINRDTGSRLPSRDDLSIMEWTLRAGERRDPTNAFWPAMLATTYFSARRDEDGIEALRRSSLKTHWDAYIYEEVLGEWRLYSAAYGDTGAIQKIGPLSLVSFPHLREIRKMAQLVRYLSEQAAAHGSNETAVDLRRELMLLGTVMCDKAQWAYEALIGTDVCMIAGTDSQSRVMPGNIRSVGQWEPQAAGYLTLLKRTNHNGDIAWLRRSIENSCVLRNRIDLARYDASYPGIPPGIPLTPLFGSWMACVCLIQEMITLLAIYSIVRILEGLRLRARNSARARKSRQTGLAVLAFAWIGSGFMATSGIPSTRFMLVFLVLSSVGFMFLLDRMKYVFTRVTGKRSAEGASWQGDRGPTPEPDGWSLIGTLSAVLLFTGPTLVGIYFLRPFLSTQHPVASALTSLVDVAHSINVTEALQVALFGSMAPLSAMVGLSVWALTRKGPVAPQVFTGVKRLAAPTIACLAFAYVVMLNRTILLDVDASRAISDAARNDLQWVLTHSGESSPEPPLR